MTFRLRPADLEDLEHLYEMAKLTGGGFTNLPADRDALTSKLERAVTSFARKEDDLGDDQFVLVLENTATGQVRGTCQVFSHVGQRWPFYSYRLNTLSQHSQELQRTVRAELLSLV
ncbi:MAG: arginine N-succinyltransferase, partial [Qipengyuania sp.]